MIIKKNKKTNIHIHDAISYNSFPFGNRIHDCKYFTELLLITNNININTINEWIDWHLDIIKVDHIVFIDNTENSIYKDILKNNRKINYISSPGILKQSEIYTTYVNMSDSEWVFPIDDDEYIYVSDRFNNSLNNYIEYLTETNNMYKYSINWHMMFSENIIEGKNNSYINTCKYAYLQSYLPDDCATMFKTIVNTKIKHLYINNDTNNIIDLDFKEIDANDTWDKYCENVRLGSVHNPISKYDNKFVHTYNPETNKNIIGFFNNGQLDIKADCFIAHYKHNSFYNWKYKINNFKFTDICPRSFFTNNYRLNKYYEIYETIKNKVLLQDNLYLLYKKYKTN